MAEGLGRYIKAAVTEGSLKGLPLHNIQPAPSHSQFVDDTLLLNSPTVQEANKLNSILSDFTEASGMLLNLDKSKLYFFNTPPLFNFIFPDFWGYPGAPFRPTIWAFPSRERQPDPSPGTAFSFPSPTD
jgi:hypothetical protein